jgi:D-alanyl-D-alanine carboxypeptidase
LSHTSGLADWLEDAPAGNRSLIDRLFEEGDRSMSLNEIVHQVCDRPIPHFPPQHALRTKVKARYSDTNFMLLKAIIEAATTQPLHQVFEELLLRPLGLAQTHLAGHSRPSAPTPDPATLWVDSRPLNLPLILRSCWGMYSSAEDSLTFLRAFVGGTLFDDPATPVLMQRRWIRFGVPLDRASLRLPTWPIEYGLRIMRFENPIPKLFA